MRGWLVVVASRGSQISLYGEVLSPLKKIIVSKNGSTDKYGIYLDSI